MFCVLAARAAAGFERGSKENDFERRTSERKLYHTYPWTKIYMSSYTDVEVRTKGRLKKNGFIDEDIDENS